ncbi:RtcB family protein [Zavarzinella formosa]|uniref:RtcB family protein n=1 Tax=Zavarzinella formosa TaxID=360055 RepID=UPI0002EB123B|nr:RtcB family protein [Zavarzinella formosa]
MQFLGKSTVPIQGWTEGVPVEEKALQQLRNVASLPFIHKHVAVMPDVHWGMGATVGSVIPTVGAIIPAAVGVDIGCGMMAVRTGIQAEDLPDNLHAIRSDIEAAIPHGRTDNGGANDRGAWGAPSPDADWVFSTKLMDRLQVIVAKHPGIARAAERAPFHIGTLGTGNHFIEFCLDEAGAVWVMLHSGSRGIGNKIGTYFIERAKAEMRRWFINLPDADLAYIPEGSELFDDYVEALHWAQEFAQANREVMMRSVLGVLERHFPGKLGNVDEVAVNCHHNYVAKENHYGKNVWLTRKGAVRARKGDMGIIPGSMGARSFIVRGKGCDESFHSCSHGAGRVMSRGEAVKRISLEDHAKATAGVECRKDEGVLDESPAAYKPIDAVMAAQKDLVEIVHELRQVICVKG